MESPSASVEPLAVHVNVSPTYPEIGLSSTFNGIVGGVLSMLAGFDCFSGE